MKYEEALSDTTQLLQRFAGCGLRTPQGHFTAGVPSKKGSKAFHRWHIKNGAINVDRVTADGGEIRAVGPE
jgi:hypothetical protein